MNNVKIILPVIIVTINLLPVSSQNTSVSVKDATELPNNYDTSTEPDTKETKDIYGNRIDNITMYCQNKPCVSKCCPYGQLVSMKPEGAKSFECIKDSIESRIMNPKLYSKNMTETNKEVETAFKLIDGEEIRNRIYTINLYPLASPYFMEDGSLTLEYPNNYHRWNPIKSDEFCMDYFIRYDTNTVVVDALVTFQPTQEENQDPTLKICGMYISSIFLLGVLAVYWFLPQLRNLHGKVLMAYISSLLVGFLCMGSILLLGQNDMMGDIECHVFTLVTYFFLLATFFWMNVMSFDIYWTFRGIGQARDTSRRGERRKFQMYCLYGYGCPLAMTCILALLNYLPMAKINRAVITPGFTAKGCFLADMELLFYLYAPMSVLILANCMFFMATTWNICQVRMATKLLRGTDNSAQKKTQNRFILYIKLFMLMGISWALEVISSLKEAQPGHLFWKFSDAYNLMLGVIIFVIFVCKKSILKMIVSRCRSIRENSSETRGNYSSRSTSSTNSCSVDPDFQSVTVNLNPDARGVEKSES